MSTVSLVRCGTYDSHEVEAAVRRAVDLSGGISSFVKPGDRVLLKPNLLSAHPPERRITTDPEVVRAVARLVLEAGGRPFIGDSPGLDRFSRVAAMTGMQAVADELGIQVIELTQPTVVTLPAPAIFRKLEIASQALQVDAVINLPKLKTHSQMLLTLVVKNLFGTIVAQRKAEWHHMAGIDRDTFASLHLDICFAVKPALNLLDGIWGMEGYGPSNGIPRRFNLIAASRDAVAMDVGSCFLMGVPPRHFPLYRVARSRGLGETDVRRITFAGESAQAFAVEDFKIPTLDSLGMIPGIFDWFTKRYLVSKPIQGGDACAGCGRCSEICPVDAIVVKDQRLTFDYERCIRCYCCQEICPHDAIRFRKGFLVRLLNRLNP